MCVPAVFRPFRHGFFRVQNPGEKGFHSLRCFSQSCRKISGPGLHGFVSLFPNTGVLPGCFQFLFQIGNHSKYTSALSLRRFGGVNRSGKAAPETPMHIQADLPYGSRTRILSMAHIQINISLPGNLIEIKIKLFHGNPIRKKPPLYMPGTLINPLPLQFRIDGQKQL